MGTITVQNLEPGTIVKTPPSSLEDQDTHHPPLEERGVGVAVRVRPLSTQELANSSIGHCVQCLKDSVVIGTSAGKQAAKGLGNSKSSLKSRQFEVDTVYHQHSTQKQVYEECCRNIVAGLFEGTNGAVLAYGATGSGKTHTMFGGPMSSAGIVYQAVQDIFEEKLTLEEEEGKNVVVKCSFVEIYNESVFDLLATPRKPTHSRTLSGTLELPQNTSITNNELKIAQWVNGRPALPVREGATPGEGGCNPEPLTIPGLTYVYPSSADEFAQAIEKGRQNRFVACTAANPQSSRSHAIITVEVHVTGGYDHVGRPCPGTIGRIRMCDLAGSERAASSSNSGMRLREGGNINRSLLALGSVVQSLLQRKQCSSQKKVFIPYRGSCLTRLLKDSIGGNCRTQMIFCLNPSTKQQEESVNTMLFAMKAKQIQVSAQRNEYTVNSEAVAKSQEVLIDELRQQLLLYEEEFQKLGVAPLESATRKLFGSSRIVSLSHRHDQSKRNSVHAEDFNGVHLYDAHNNSLLSSSLDLADQSETRLISPTAAVTRCVNKERSESPGKSPGLRCRRQRTSTSSTESSSAQFLEVEKKLRELMAEKESQYWRNRETKERIVARDLQLRELKWKLARFLASNELGVRIRGDPATTSGGTVPTPVGVAGMRNTIRSIEEEQLQATSDLDSMMMDMDKIDRRIEAIRSEAPRDKNQVALELLFENMKLRQNCTEAEHLASDFHQECRQSSGRINEYQEALSVCVSALHSVIPHLPHNSTAMADAKLALFYANLPHASTADMIRVFEASLKADSTPPLVPINNCASPPKRLQVRSAPEDDLFVAIQDLEESFHTLTLTPPRRHRGYDVSSSVPEMCPSVRRVEAPLVPEKQVSMEAKPNVDAANVVQVEEPPRQVSTSPVPTPVPKKETEKVTEKKAPTTGNSSGREVKDSTKISQFTRFYSSTSHLSSSSSSNTIPLSSSSTRNSVTPTRRRRELEKESMNHAQPTTTSFSPFSRAGVASPLRNQGKGDGASTLKRPTSTVTRNGRLLAGRPSASPIPSPQQTPTQHVATQGDLSSTPKRGSPLVVHKSGPHVVAVEERRRSPVVKDPSRVRMRGSGGDAAVAAPPPLKGKAPASTPGLPKAASPAKTHTAISKRVPKKPPPSPEEDKSDDQVTHARTRAVTSSISPVSGRSTRSRRTPGPSVTSPGLPGFSGSSLPSVLSVDDMLVSRSTFSELDDLDDISSTFSQFTPREAQYCVR